MPKSRHKLLSKIILFSHQYFLTKSRKIEGLGYNSVFTSGSVKKAAVAWSEYYFHHDRSQRSVAFSYLMIVICFTLGAIISAQLLPFFRMKTIWIATFLILVTDSSYYLTKRKNVNK